MRSIQIVQEFVSDGVSTMPPQSKYATPEERKEARAVQQRLRREAQRHEARSDLGELGATVLSQPPRYSNAEEARAARNERRRLRRRSAAATLQGLTGIPTQSNDVVTDDQQLATEVQDTQDLLVDQLEELAIAADGQDSTSQEANELQQSVGENGQELALAPFLQSNNDRVEVQRDQSPGGQIDVFATRVAVTSSVTEPGTQHHVEVYVKTEAEVESEHDAIAHLEPIALAPSQPELDVQTIALEEAVQHTQDSLPEEALQVPVQTNETIYERPQNRDANVFTELDDDAYVDFGNDDVTDEHEGREDTSSLRLQEEAIQEARQAAANHIYALASHRCYNHDHGVADGQAWTRPQSLWDVAQHTNRLLKTLPNASADGRSIPYQPLKNQKLPHIDQYANVDWKSLYGADDPLDRNRGQLSFKLSQDEALRRLGGRVSLRRRWDVDSIMFRTTTLGVFNEGAELCFYPPGLGGLCDARDLEKIGRRSR